MGDAPSALRAKVRVLNSLAKLLRLLTARRASRVRASLPSTRQPMQTSESDGRTAAHRAYGLLVLSSLVLASCGAAGAAVPPSPRGTSAPVPGRSLELATPSQVVAPTVPLTALPTTVETATVAPAPAPGGTLAPTPRPPTSTPRATMTPIPPRTVAPTARTNCDPSYPTVCIPPLPPDLDCGQIPFRRFVVRPPDPHRFDADRDGVGCE